MPIYDYECAACGERFDKLIRSISQPLPEIICPACQSTEVQRLISAPTIRAGSASGETQAAETTTSTSEKPAFFGRKELLAAQEQKRQLRERVKHGED
jgi:putative FmdB family regulatory protein